METGSSRRGPLFRGVRADPGRALSAVGWRHLIRCCFADGKEGGLSVFRTAADPGNVRLSHRSPDH